MLKSSRWTVACPVLLLGIVAVALSDILSVTDIPIYRDLPSFFIPFKMLVAEHLRRGELPLWNSSIYMGTPLAASLHAGAFYPLTAVLLLGFPLGFNLSLFLHVCIGLLGMYAFQRARGLPIAAVACASLTFAIGGYLVSTINLPTHLQAAAWSPWALLASLRLSEDRTSARSLAGVVVTIALEILSGAPEVAILTIGLCAAMLLFDGGVSSLPRFAAAVGMAIGLTAFQILPTLEYAGASVRAVDVAFSTIAAMSVEPVSFLQLVFPHSSYLWNAGKGASLGPMFEEHLPWIQSLYIGLASLSFAAAGASQWRRSRFWVVTVGIGALLALGSHTPLFSLIDAALPAVVEKFRYPEKFWFLVHLGLCVLTAEGVAAVLRRQRSAELAMTACVALCGSLAIGVMALRWLAPQHLLGLTAELKGVELPPTAYVTLAVDLFDKAQRAAAILATLVVILVLARRELIQQGLASVLVLLLIAVDLGSAHYNLNLTIPWRDLAGARPLVDPAGLRERHLRIFHYASVEGPTGDPRPAGIDQFRQGMTNYGDLRAIAVGNWSAMYTDIVMAFGVENVSGWDGLVRTSDRDLRSMLARGPFATSLRLLRLYSVGAIAGMTPLEDPSLVPLAPSDVSPFYAYELKDPVPIAYLARRLHVAASNDEAFAVLRAPEFVPGEHAVVTELPPNWNQPSEAPNGDRVEIVRRDPEEVVLHAVNSEPALLVLNDSFFPGWQATVDGGEEKIFRANVFVRGVTLARGDHTVEFRYRPRSFWLGSMLSSLCVVSMLASWWLWRRGARGNIGA